MDNNLNTKMAVATKWSSLAEIAAKLIIPVVNMILARLLTPASFGIVATINIVITFAEVFQDAGFQKFIIQHDFADEDDFKQSSNVAFWTNLIISLLLFAVICVFNKPIAGLVGDSSLGLEIIIASLSIPIFSLSSMQAAQYKKRMDFKRLFYARIITSTIPLFITVPLAFVLKNHWALIIGTLIRNVILVFVLSYKSIWKPSFYYSFKKLNEMLSFCIWTLFESITIWLSGNANIFIVTRILGQESVGLFKNSIATSTSILGIVSAATIPVLFAALSKCKNDDTEFYSIFYDYQKLIALLVVPMGLGILLYRNLATLILLGNNWMECADFIGLYSLSHCFTIITCNFFSELYRAKGKPKISLIAQLIYISALIPATYFSASYSFKALCIVTALSLPFFAIVHFLLVKIFFREIKIRIILFNTSQALLPSAIMLVVSIVLQQISKSILWGCVSILLCAIAYFGAVILIPPLRRTISNNPITSTLYLKIKGKLLKKNSDE